jgi:hypothetical protein
MKGMEHQTLSELQLDKTDFITSDKLFYFCKALNHKKLEYIKTDFIKNRNKSENIVSNQGWRESDTLVHLDDIHVLVTGHSDYDVSENELDILEKPHIKKWFCENLNVHHPKLVSLPIGITNKEEPNSWVHSIIGNTDRILTVSKTPKLITNLVYMNFTISNFPEEREQIHHLYKDKEWVTVGSSEVSEKGHLRFLNEIYSHKFCFAPRGNGIDTHRMWESLYLRTIPIVKKCLAMEQFYDLPILFIDNWDSITEDFLNKKYEEIMQKKYPLYKIKIDYWFQMIQENL